MAIYIQGAPDFDRFEILKTATVTVARPSVSLNNSTANAENTTNYQHNLNFIPSVIAYVLVSGIYLPLPYSLMDADNHVNGSFNNWVFIHQSYRIDATKITFFNRVSASSTSAETLNGFAMTAKFYILGQTSKTL